ncbi:MAG: Unknown protein [uncultured Campylobacterales bacterium]|uniref:Lipoprotein n=1 Tax=uncultured Campylobacterales bacterium TaxID=352960 RepID=A0A6S6SLA0_9BACT|nr:MAG: Unknown protein [uncultured Campylobacterales bacterium]
MKKSLLILSLTLLFVGCDMSSSGVAEAERELEERAIQEEIDDYRRTLPITDLNHPEYVLPQDPGSAGKDELLGIDSNDNGIRDDVEIYIYNRYKNEPNHKRVLIAIASQYAKATQKILVDPKNAYDNETYKIMDNAGDCKWYFYDKHDEQSNLKSYELVQFSINNNPYDEKLKDKIYNTKERIQEKFKYEESLGGKIYPDTSHDLIKCETNLDKLGEI